MHGRNVSHTNDRCMCGYVYMCTKSCVSVYLRICVSAYLHICVFVYLCVCVNFHNRHKTAQEHGYIPEVDAFCMTPPKVRIRAKRGARSLPIFEVCIPVSLWMSTIRQRRGSAPVATSTAARRKEVFTTEASHRSRIFVSAPDIEN